MHSFTQLAGGTPNPMAWPPLDDTGAHGGKPPKAIKTRIRQMQPFSCLILYQAVRSGCLPHDLINFSVDDILKRVRVARVLEQIIQELYCMCPRMPVDESWLVMATYEL